MALFDKHSILERHGVLLTVGILLVVAIGGIIEIAPLYYLKNTIEKVDGMRPYTPLELAGRNIYIREEKQILESGKSQAIKICRHVRTSRRTVIERNWPL